MQTQAPGDGAVCRLGKGVRSALCSVVMNGFSFTIVNIRSLFYASGFVL